METDALRHMTAVACLRLGGRLWPNGIGFNAGGWEYVYLERSNTWQATRAYRLAKRMGWGDSPEQARDHARARGVQHE